MSHAITLIPGDGIGPEVTAATRRVVEAAGISVDWEVHDAGAAQLGLLDQFVLPTDSRFSGQQEELARHNRMADHPIDRRPIGVE